MRPLVEQYCVACHSPEKMKGDLDLSAYNSIDKVAAEFARWDLVRERVAALEMPPEKAERQPTPAERAKLLAWITALRTDEANRHAGDPGPVFARRLSNAEYDYTIRDLTGVDIRPARAFPVDPANQAGFDNSAESLTMTPGLLKKYLQAAREVADHLVLKPDGLDFAPHPVVADTDRDKYCVNRIIAFYQRQRTDYADYFLAAWRHRRDPDTSLDQLAVAAQLSPKYLRTIWSTLTKSSDDVGPIAALKLAFNALPVDDDEPAARAGCQRMRDLVVALREKLIPVVPNLTAPKVHNGSQSLVLWKDRKMAANRRRYAGGALELPIATLLPAGLPDTAARAMAVPAEPDAAAEWESTFTRFCATFPDAFVVSERARVYLNPEKEKQLAGRLLSAGFHSQMGYFRDDGPLYDLMLDDAQRAELDRLWKELDFIASAPFRQYTGFIWFDRTDSSFMRDREFDFARAEDKDCTSLAKMKRLCDVYLAKAIDNGAGDEAAGAIRDYFTNMSASIRWIESARLAAEPIHLRELTRLAERAYRRPLTVDERNDITAFYRSLRDKDNLTHEDAVRDTLVRVLMSPHFCYRLDLPQPQPTGATAAIRPLDDVALANRLSYFLWSSMPDQALLDLAAAGQLHDPDVLTAQARRMLRDDRATRFATEFVGHWLDFRRFQEHNGVDRARFPAFTNDLREAMFEEPVRFFVDLARRDASVLDLLYADHTFVNRPLAEHYGMPSPAEPGRWVRVDDAGKYGRGGLLPMAVFLTQNAPGLRTSPVKRGNWIVKRVLGEHIPPPPPKVPELPADESKLGDLTLRQTLERHRQDPSCAACHERFDALGLVFEGYGPVGERRDKDLGGRPVENTATFPGGTVGAGLAGLRDYVRQRRQSDFIDNLCRQMLAYGLGRTLLPSDDATLADMRRRLERNGYHFQNLIDAVVTSPQFRNKRVVPVPSPGTPGEG